MIHKQHMHKPHTRTHHMTHQNHHNTIHSKAQDYSTYHYAHHFTQAQTAPHRQAQYFTSLALQDLTSEPDEHSQSLKHQQTQGLQDFSFTSQVHCSALHKQHAIIRPITMKHCSLLHKADTSSFIGHCELHHILNHLRLLNQSQAQYYHT